MVLVYILKLLTVQHGISAVHCAAMEGHKEVVELLIDKYNLSATDKDNVSLDCMFGVYADDSLTLTLNHRHIKLTLIHIIRRQLRYVLI